MNSGSRPRILVLGAGSIGQRHASNLLAKGASVAIADPVADKAFGVPGAEPIDFDLDKLGDFDGVVVASPTIHHRHQSEAALSAGAYVLVEKPLDVSTTGIDSLVRLGKDRLMVGFNLRLHQPLERLVSWVKEGRLGIPLGVSVWFGSYLPDWRQDCDYRSSYSARQDLGGGVLLDAIHELDLLVWTLGGPIKVICATVDRIGSLEIETEDSVKALLRHRDGAVIDLSLDYLSRRYRRGITVVGSEGTAHYDWTRAILELHGPTTAHSEQVDTQISTSYEREAEAFLRFMREEAPPPVDAATAAVSLGLADAIRDAAST